MLPTIQKPETLSMKPVSKMHCNILSTYTTHYDHTNVLQMVVFVVRVRVRVNLTLLITMLTQHNSCIKSSFINLPSGSKPVCDTAVIYA